MQSPPLSLSVPGPPCVGVIGIGESNSPLSAGLQQLFWAGGGWGVTQNWSGCHLWEHGISDQQLIGS